MQMAQNRNGLNLSTVQANTHGKIMFQLYIILQIDIKIFPSLSQTPKFDIVGGLKVLA